MLDHAFKLNVGRKGFGSVNPEIRIIEGRIIEVLLYILFQDKTFSWFMYWCGDRSVQTANPTLVQRKWLLLTVKKKNPTYSIN